MKSILLTGDNPQSAAHIAESVGITSVHSECLHEDKMLAIDQYKKKSD